MAETKIAIFQLLWISEMAFDTIKEYRTSKVHLVRIIMIQ